MASNIQFKRGTAAALYAANPVLLRGEPGLEIDTSKIKYGNGVTPWRDLPYGNPALEVVDGGELSVAPVAPVPGTFSPPSLSGLQLWLDGTDPDYVHIVNNRLSIWEDMSPAREKFVQSNKLNRPIASNQIEEQDVVTFDGVNDGMLSNFTLPAEFTLLVALKRRGPSTHGRVIAAYNANNSNELVLCGTATGSEFGVRSGGTYSATQPVDDLVPVIYTLQFTAAGFSTRLNGLNTQAGEALTVGALSRFSIGALRADLAEGNYSGDIAEVVLYDRVLTAPELLDAETYMLARWGIVQASHPLIEGMTAFWPLNEESGNRIDITDAAVPLTPTGAVAFEPGVIANAAKFTGGMNYLTAPTDFTLAGSFSLSLWFKPAAVTGGMSELVQNWDGNALTGQVVLLCGDEGGETGALVGFIRTSTGAHRVSFVGLTANAWHHAVLSYNSAENKLTLYHNGEIADQVITTGALVSSATPLRVGVGEKTTRANDFAFLADQLGIWNRVLSLQDAQMLYNDELGKEDFTADLYGDNVSLLLHMDKPANAAGLVGGGSSDPNFNDVALLLHMNGPGFTDSSLNSLAVVATGAEISAVQSKFGGASGYFDGVGDFIAISDASLASGFGASEDFTIEGWFFPQDDPGGYVTVAGLFSPDATQIGWLFQRDSSIVRFVSITTEVVLINGGTFAAGNWYHLAVTRSGGTTRFFQNGVLQGEPTNLGSYSVVPGETRVGGNGLAEYFNGYIDDLRITKGVARYTADFTPPTAEFPDNSAPTDPNFNDVTLLLNLNGPGITDSSPKAHQITNNGATISTAQSKFGGASAYFDSTGYLSAPSDDAFNFGTGDFTIEGWFRISAISQYMRIFSRGDWASPDMSSHVALEINSTSGGILWLGDIASQQAVSDLGLQLDTWHHVAMARAGGIVKLFIDGVEKFSATNTTNVNNSAAFYVGTLGGLAGLPDLNYNGYIDDFRVTKGVARYTTNFTPPTAEFPLGPIKTVTMPTVETALLLHFDGASFVDSGANGLTVTANGATLSTTESKFGGASGYFDGVADLQFTPSVETQFGADDFTVEFWLYITDEPQNNQVIISFCNWPNTSGIVFGYTDTLFSAYTGGFTSALSVSRPVNNTWHHYAAVRINGQLSLFIDGVKQTPTNQTGTFSGNFTDGLQFIGRPTDANSYQLHGYIDELRVTKGAGLYGADFTPPTAPFANPQPTPDLLITFDAGLEDLSANAHTITNNNNVGTGLPTAPSAGFGNAGTFNGTNAHLVIPDAPEFDLSSGPFCIELRFYASALAPNIETASSCLISKDQWGVSFSWGIFIAANGVRVATANIAGDWNFPVTQTITSNAWHHIAVTGDGTTMKLFYDGVLIGTKNRTLTNAAADVTIGCGSYNNPNSFFTGDIDNVRIVKGAQVYTANFTPPTASLTAPVVTPAPDLLLHFDGANSSTTFTDHGKNQLALTAAVGTSISTAQSKFGGSSAYFDGNSFVETSPDEGLRLADHDFTIEMWLYPLSLAGYWLRTDSGNTQNGLLLGYDGAGFYVTSNGFAWDMVASQVNVWADMVANQWQHVVVTRQENVFRAFLNGVMTYSVTAAGVINQVSPLVRLGSPNNPAAQAMNCYIDEFRLIKGAAVYTSNFTPPVAPFQNPIITITQPAAGLANGLEAFWKFDDLTDSTGNGHDLVDINYTTITPGLVGGALTFDANNGLQYAKISNFKILRAAGFSISGWFKSANPTQSSPPFVISHGIPFGFCYGSMVTLEYNSFNAGNNPCFGPTSTAIRIPNPAAVQDGLDGNWHHLAGTFDGSVGKFYVDGVLIGEQTGITMDDTWPVPDTYFGSGMAEYARTGQLDSVAYWTRGLSESEVLALYNNGNGTETLTGGGGGGAGPITTFIDSSKHNHEITAVGSAYLNLTDIKYGNASGEFAGGYCTIPMSPAFALGAGDFTVEFWGNLNYVAGGVVFSTASEEDGTYLIGFRNDPNMFGFCYDMANFTFVSADISAYYAEWAHYAFVRLDGVLKMYVNGTQVGTANTTIDFTGGTQPTAVIGRRFVGDDEHYLDGLIDDLRITKGVARYISNFNPPTKAFPDPVLTTPLPPVGDIYAENVTLLLHMDGANGSTTFTDNSYLQNTVTAEGGAVISTAQSKFGGASGYFNDSNLAINDWSGFGSADFTVEFWIYLTGNKAFSNNSVNHIIGQHEPFAGADWLVGTLGDTGSLCVNNGSDFSFGTNQVAENVWHHVALVRSGVNLKLFLNGIQEISMAAPASFANNFPLSIGGTVIPGSWLGCYIDDLRITKGVARYTANFLPPTAAFPAPVGDSGGLASGLLAFWGMNETGGNRADNVSGQLMTPVNGTIGSAAGLIGNAADITNGETAWFELPAGICDIGAGQKTFSMWFKLAQTGVGYQWMWHHGAARDSTECIPMYIESSGFLNCIFTTTDYMWSNYVPYTGFSAPTANEWHHAVAVFNGSTCKVYYDGVETNSQSYTGAVIATGGQYAIGTYPAYNPLANPGAPYISVTPFNGQIDAVGIWDRALTAAEVTELYSGGAGREIVKLSPASIAGLDLWLDSTSGVNTVNGAIATWADKSAFGRTATPADYAPAPIVAAAAGPNGQDVVRFSGDPNVLDVSYQFNLKDSSGFILVQHAADITSGTYGRFLSFQPANGFDYDQADGLAFSTNQGNPTGVGLYNNGIGAAHAMTLPLGWTLLSYTIDANGEAKLRVDGVEVASETFTGIAPTAGGNLYIGHGGSLGLIEALQGDIAMIALYDHALGEAALIGLENAITQQWFPAPTPPGDGETILLLHFDGPNNTATFVDSSTPPKNISAETNSVVTSTQAKFGQSAYFNGAGYRVYTDSSPVFDISGGAYTIEFWLYLNAALPGDAIRLFTFEAASGERIGMLLYQDPGDTLYRLAMNKYGIPVGFVTPEVVQAGQWTHIAFVRNGSNNTLYVNGTSTAQTLFGAANWHEQAFVADDYSVSIGANTAPFAFYGLDGYIDEFRIVKGAAVYTSNFTPPTRPFGAAELLLHFDADTSDSSGSNVGITNSGVTIDAVTTKFGGGSAYFNGNLVSTLTTVDSPAFGFGTGDFTIEMFVKQQSAIRNSVLSIGTYVDGILWRLAPALTDSLYLAVSAPGGGYLDWDATASVPIDTWAHIALTRQNGTLRAFINGVKVFEQTGVTVDLGASRPLMIGCGAHELQPIDAYHGYIDELRIIKGEAVYTANFTPPTAPFN